MGPGLLGEHGSAAGAGAVERTSDRPPLARNLDDRGVSHNAGGGAASALVAENDISKAGASLAGNTYSGRNRKRRNPMAQFDDRRDAMEKKFAHDEELRFKATARRNKMLGLWVAGQLGRSGPEADAYAKSVVVADFEEAGDDDVLRKVKADLEAGGVQVSDAALRTRMDELLVTAVNEVSAGR